MKFSIIITLFKGEKLIEKTLDAVLSQTYKDYEVVLVNDESPDNVGDIVKKYISNHPGVDFVYLEQKNKGLGGARNTGIRSASGEIMAILDQDDIWYPNKLELTVKAFDEHPEISIVCHNLYKNNNCSLKEMLVTGPNEKDMYRKLLFEGNRLAASATSFKKSAIEDAGYFSEDIDKLHMVEDYDLWLKMASKGHKFYFIEDILGEYVLHGDNLGADFSNYELTCKGELWVINSHYKLLDDKRPIDRILLRKRIGDSLFIAAYKAFFNEHSMQKGLSYLVKAIFENPFLLFRAIKRSIKPCFAKIR